MCEKLILFFCPNILWKWRFKGWETLENLVVERIKNQYPEQAEEMIFNLLA